MAKNIVERTSKDYGGFKDSFDQIAGILSLLAPDPNDPLEYIGASAGPYGLPVLLARKLQKAKDLIERGKANSRMGAQMGSDAEMDAGEELINEGNALIREVMSEPGVSKKQIDEFLNPPMPKSDLTKEQQLEKIKNLKEKFGPVKKTTRQERNPDYPNRLLSDKLNSNDVAKILEEHGFVEAQQYGKRLGINEYEFTDDGKIIAYETTKDLLGRPSTTQRTFDSPTLKRIRNYLGYKEGGLVKGLKASGTTMNYGDYGRSYK